MFEGLFSIWKKIKLTLANFFVIWPIYVVLNGTKLHKKSRHPVTL